MPERRAVRDRERYEYARSEIKARVTMPEILTAYYHTGKQNKICCPFHEEKTPSFSYQDKIWTCFGCGKKGDVIDFVKEFFNISFYEAIEKIDSDFRLYNLDVELTPQRKAEIEAKAAERAREATEKDKLHEHFMELLDKQAELDKQLMQHRPTESSTPEEIMEYCRISSELEYVSYQVDEATVEIFVKNHGESALPERKDDREKEESKMPMQKEPAYTVDDFTKELMDGCLQKTGSHEKYMSMANKLLSELRLNAVALGLMPDESIPAITITDESVNSIIACNIPPKRIPPTFEQDNFILTSCNERIHTTDNPHELITNLKLAASYVNFMVAVAEETQGLRKAVSKEQAKSETVNQPAQAPVENKSKGARRKMKLDVKTYVIDNAAPNDKGNRLLANSTVSVDGGALEFQVRLTEDKEGKQHIILPSYMDKDGKFQNYVIPASKEVYAELLDAVSNSYFSTVRGDKAPEEKENITPGWLSIANVSPYDSDKTKAFVTAKYGDSFSLHGLKLVMSQNDKLFLALPTTDKYTNSRGETIYPRAFDMPDRARFTLQGMAIKGYNKALETQAALAAQKGQEPHLDAVKEYTANQAAAQPAKDASEQR